MSAKAATARRAKGEGDGAAPAAGLRGLVAGERDSATGWLVGHPTDWGRRWLVTQAQLAEILGITGRQIQNLEARGLPNEGARTTKLYPLMDACAWFSSYKVRLALRDAGEKVQLEWIDPRVARAEWAMARAKDDAETAADERRQYGRELTDPEYRALDDRNQYLEGDRFLEALVDGRPKKALAVRRPDTSRHTYQED